ncbi:MAG: ribosome maturation factor RimM [Caldilineaceae bacterium]|nr:ribosome maturation factor RimM [Caldilineaceae bacterium]
MIYQHRNERVFIPDGYLAIGRITAPHSLQGEVRVELHTDFPERFAEGINVYVGNGLTEMVVEAARPHKQMMLVKLSGITNRTVAETLRGQWIFVHEADAVALEEDTFWVHDIIGMTVQTEAGEKLGVVSDIIFTGANDVYVVQGTDDEGNPREVLLPAIADVVQHVDPEEQLMTVHLLPGLLP